MMSTFEQLQKDAKILAANGRLVESLEKFEQARKIKETPKILQRIQKLKDFMALNGCDENEEKSTHSSSSDAQVSKTPRDKKREDKSGASPGAKILNQIQNIKIDKGNNFERLSETKSPEEVKISNPPIQHKPDLEQFDELRKKAIDLSYVGNFEDSLELFSKAYEIKPCPKIKEYMEKIKAMASQHAEKLRKVKDLTSSVKKLVKEGNRVESLKSLKDAYAVCPSPSISTMIKRLETPNHLKHSSELSGSFRAEKLSANEKAPDSPEHSSQTVFTFPKPINSFRSENLSGNSNYSKNIGSSTSSTGDLSALSPKKLARYKFLYQKAKEDAGEGKLEASLKALLEAKSICATDKIVKRLTDLQVHMKNLEESGDEGNNMIELAKDFYLFHEVYKKMYPYQREGVAWMWGLFQKKKGGILGDDMGLGKTFQVIAFLSGLIDAEKVKHVLIIMPVSLLPNWEREFKKWCPGIVVNTFHTGTKREKERKVLRIQRKGHVLLTSYGMTLSNDNYLTKCEGRDFIWDYVILDEGHKIKNPTKTTKAVYEIPSRNRLVLTGTPIQNNLAELWALFDFAHQGTLLGTMKTFKMTYENTITRAREKDATAGEKRLGTEMADNLKKLISPYFLRRTKAEVFNVMKTSELEDGIGNLSIQENRLTARKNDMIMWVFLSDIQCELYQNFLHSDAVKTILLSKRSPLVELTILKKICDHPRLLSHRACLQLGLNGQLSEEDLERELEDESSYSASISNVSDETLIAESGKMKFLINLLEELRGTGHRTLVFSMSRKILDMVHRILVNRNWKVMRIDGTISKMEERERRIQLFQKDPSYSVFLLTTQVGGVGITLTAADRVVIYDPSWNPATDAQAVDRVYRIGQQKNVVVYRLITCGSVEEKIYRRQVFKDSITRQATGAADPYRYFSKQELRELFILDNPHHSATQTQLHSMHSEERKSDPTLNEHIAYLHSLNIFGISDHDLMFSKNVADQSEDNDEGTVSHNYIKQQVTLAQARIQDEAAVVEEGITISGRFARPYPSIVQTFKKNSVKDTYVPPTFPETSSTFSASTNLPQGHSYMDLKASNLVRHRLESSVKIEDKVKNWLTETENVTHNKDSSTSKEDEEFCTPLTRSSTQYKHSTESMGDSLDGSNRQLSKKDSLGQSTELVNLSNLEEKKDLESYSPVKSEKNIDSIPLQASPIVNITSDEKNTPENSVIILENYCEEKDETEASSQSNQNNSSIKHSQDPNLDPKSPRKSKSSIQDSFISGDLNKNSEVIDSYFERSENSKREDSPGRVTQNLDPKSPRKSKSSIQDSFLSDDLNKNSEIDTYSEENGNSKREDSPRRVSQNLNTTKNPSNNTDVTTDDKAYTQYRSLDQNVSDANTSAELESLFDEVGPTSTPLKKYSSGDHLAHSNSILLTDLSFDEQPVMKRKSIRKSCARKQDVDFDSEPESNADDSEVEIGPDSEDEVVSENEHEVVPDTEDELVPESLNESNIARTLKSGNLESPSIVPSSIPNSPFLSRSPSVSKRITALRLQRSGISADSPFAKAMAVSPVIDVEQFERIGLSSTSMTSSSDINSPIFERKKKRAVITESEDEN